MVGIIVVNYKTPWHLNECLKSVFKYSTDFHLILVQNDPDLNSKEIGENFKKKYSEKITIIVNNENLGYVGGVNSAFKKAMEFPKVCFLNSDIIVTKTWLTKLNEVLDNDPAVSQVSPDSNHFYPEKTYFRILKKIGFKFSKRLGFFISSLEAYKNPPRSKVKGFQASNKIYHFCTGACNLTYTKYFENLGYFLDPNIIHGYGDDFDLSYYLRQFGKFGTQNDSYVFHFINTSFQKLGDEVLKAKLQTLNRLYVIDKWKERIKEDLIKLDLNEILNTWHSDELKTMLSYLGLLKTHPELSEYIKTIPAKEIGEKLGIKFI